MPPKEDKSVPNEAEIKRLIASRNAYFQAEIAAKTLWEHIMGTTKLEYLAPNKLDQIAKALQEGAIETPYLERMIAMRTQPYVPPDSRAFNFWIYHGCVSLRCSPPHRASAAVAFARMVAVEPPPENWNYLNWQPALSTASQLNKLREEKQDAVPAPHAGVGVFQPLRAAPIRHKKAQNNNSLFPWPQADQPKLSLAVQNGRSAAIKPRVHDNQVIPLKEWFKDAIQIIKWDTPSEISQPYHIFNPSIIPHPEKPETHFLVNLRLGNYHILRVFDIESKGEKNKYDRQDCNTRNLLMELPVDFTGSTFDSKWWKEWTAPPPPFPHPISGLEDVRLIWDPNAKKLRATYTSLEMKDHTQGEQKRENLGPRLCMLELDYKTAQVKPGTPVVVEPPIDKHSSQKNWATFYMGQHLHAVYGMNPLTVMTIDPSTGESQLAEVNKLTVENDWKGSSPLIRLSAKQIEKLKAASPHHSKNVMKSEGGDEWFFSIVHVSHFPKYSHAFAVFRARPTTYSSIKPLAMDLIYHSRPFVFQLHDIEFTCGMAITPDEQTVVLPYAVRDETCYCARFPLERLWKEMIDTPIVSEILL